MWIVWVFAMEDEPDRVHMVSVEGPIEGIFDVFDRMEASYKYEE